MIIGKICDSNLENTKYLLLTFNHLKCTLLKNNHLTLKYTEH